MDLIQINYTHGLVLNKHYTLLGYKLLPPTLKKILIENFTILLYLLYVYYQIFFGILIDRVIDLINTWPYHKSFLRSCVSVIFVKNLHKQIQTFCS